MPKWPLQRECPAFYGNPRKAGWLQANTVDVVCPWPLNGHPNASIRIHKKCEASLRKVLGGIWDAVGHSVEKIHALHYDVYDGSYVLRAMRGGNALSMHSYAIAIDFDAKDNAFHSTKHFFHDDSLIVVKFKEEGWIWGGDWSPGSVDAMHFQAARIHA